MPSQEPDSLRKIGRERKAHRVSESRTSDSQVLNLNNSHTSAITIDEEEIPGAEFKSPAPLTNQEKEKKLAMNKEIVKLAKDSVPEIEPELETDPVINSSTSPRTGMETIRSTTGSLSTSTDDETGRSRMKKTQKCSRANDGPWLCRLCTAKLIQTKTGMKKHYRNHYKIWDLETDTLEDMNEDERSNQESTKAIRSRAFRFPTAQEVGAVPVSTNLAKKKFPGSTRNIPAALGRPVESPASSGDDSGASTSLTRSVGPTVRIPTKPKPPTTGNRDRSAMIQVPEKSKAIATPKLPKYNQDDIETDPGSDNDDVLWVADEPRPKVKNEFISFEQVIQRPKLTVLKQLLLYGVEATFEAAKKKIWPPMTTAQMDKLRTMYEIMLGTEPLVRQLDKTMEF